MGPAADPDPAARVSLSPDRRSQSRATAGLAFLSVALTMVVSAPLLTVLGVPYDAPYGAFVFKLHPGTYVLAAAFALALAERGNPLAELGRSLAHQPAVALHLLAVALAAAYAVARHGPSGAAFFVDSLFAPGVLALLLARLDPGALRRLFALVVGLLALNATLGVAEQLLQARLVPLTVLGGEALEEDVFRATALMGHPLANAVVTGFGLFAFYALRDVRARLALCWLAIAALLSFGGRTALGLSLGLLGPLAAFDALRALRRGELTFRVLTGGAVVLVLLLGALLLAVALGGVGERILGRLAWDDSAQVREVSLTVYRFLRPGQILQGVSPAEIEALIRRLGLDYPNETIENFWIVLSLQIGAVLGVVFTAGFLAFLWRLGAIGGTPVRLGFLGFVLTISTSNSLSTKTSVLSAVVAITYGCAAYRLGRAGPPHAAAGPAWAGRAAGRPGGGRW